LTPQREAILRYLASARNHPTAYQVYQAVRATFPHVGKATVYNTLNLMARLGLLVELKRDEGAVRYETDTSPHANLICLRCGQVEDAPLLASVEVRMPEEDGFDTRYVRVDLYGYCARCQREISQNEEAEDDAYA
jgi:Fur family peroxide stress response transcriptional regulator